MKKALLVLMVFMGMMSVEGRGQIIQDTISYISCNPCTSGVTGILNCTYFKTITNYTPYLLVQKGIVPGMTIYGIAFLKADTVSIQSGAYASFDIKYRMGNNDSGYYNNSINGMYDTTYSINYYVNNYMMNGFNGGMQYSTSAGNLNIPNTWGWLPFMLDQPIVYTGGSIEVFTDWHSNINALNSFQIKFASKYANGYSSFYQPNIHTTYPSINCTPGLNGWPLLTGNRYSLIIYHSPAPQPCNGIPNSGGISGSQYVCVGKDFHLYLVNPSAGPDIYYQWQQTPISTGIWTNIAGATNASLNYNFTSATPTNFRCKVTCTNTNQSAYTLAFPIYPFAVHIDSVTHSITNNVLSVHCYTNDTSSTSSGAKWNFGDSSTISYYGTQVQKTYTVDGTYMVKVVWKGDCSSDSLTFPINIGCAGSPTFSNTIAALKDSTCLGTPATLQINDTLPSNYTLQWYRFTWTGYVPLTGSSGASIQVYPGAPFDVYLNKATCNISGNFKWSNMDTVYITPPPVAGTITATNTTGNYYSFTNNGMSNAQSYTWYFGDGDSSSSLSPSHHYNLSGSYTVHFVTYNSGNGCTDTATTTVNITTGIEDVQGKLFSVSPNPFSESFVVSCPSGKGTIVVTDAVGKVVVSYQLPVVSGSQPLSDHTSTPLSDRSLKIDMKGYAAGVYLIKYTNENQTETVKVVKE